MLNQQIGEVGSGGAAGGRGAPQARLLMTQPGVGPNTALAFVLTIGDVTPISTRQAGGQLSGTDSARGKFGRTAEAGRDHASKATGWCDRCWWKRRRSRCVSIPGFRKQYLHRCHQKPKGVAKVAAARRLAVRLYWMLRTEKRVSRDRSHREQPAGAPGRRKLDRDVDWALSHPAVARAKDGATDAPWKTKKRFPLSHRPDGGWMFA